MSNRTQDPDAGKREREANMTAVECTACGPVEHFAIREDEAHCPCPPALRGYCLCLCHDPATVTALV